MASDETTPLLAATATTTATAARRSPPSAAAHPPSAWPPRSPAPAPTSLWPSLRWSPPGNPRSLERGRRSAGAGAADVSATAGVHGDAAVELPSRAPRWWARLTPSSVATTRPSAGVSAAIASEAAAAAAAAPLSPGSARRPPVSPAGGRRLSGASTASHFSPQPPPTPPFYMAGLGGDSEDPPPEYSPGAGQLLPTYQAIERLVDSGDDDDDDTAAWMESGCSFVLAVGFMAVVIASACLLSLLLLTDPADLTWFRSDG